MNMSNQQKNGSTEYSTEKIKVVWKYTNFYKKIIIWSWERKKLPNYVEKRIPKGNNDE
jgi:hypothetical protein